MINDTNFINSEYSVNGVILYTDEMLEDWKSGKILYDIMLDSFISDKEIKETVIMNANTFSNGKDTKYNKRFYNFTDFMNIAFYKTDIEKQYDAILNESVNVLTYYINEY